MLSKKEKEAIEKLKETSKQCHNSKCWEEEFCPDCYVEVEDILAIDTVLNLIDRLKKEDEKKEKKLNRQFKLLNKEEKQINQALEIAFNYGQTDGVHHKAWVIDQMVRALTGKKYDKWVNDYIYDEETGDSYTWDKGIAP